MFGIIGILVAAGLAALYILKVVFPRMDRVTERKAELMPGEASPQPHPGYIGNIRELWRMGKVRWGQALPLDPKLPWTFKRWCRKNLLTADLRRHISDDPRLDPKLTELLQQADQAHLDYLFAKHLVRKHIGREDATDFEFALKALRAQDRLLTALTGELARIALHAQAPAA
jgi:hypothetical protein